MKIKNRLPYFCGSRSLSKKPNLLLRLRLIYIKRSYAIRFLRNLGG